MKQYIYSPREAGLEAWPSGELRLEGIEVTGNPEEADVFVCPGNLSLFQDEGRLDVLPFMATHEERHVFMDVSDNFTTALRRKCMFIRCDVRSWMLKDDPNSIAFAWPVEDFAECVELPDGGFRFDVSFQGWLSTPARTGSSAACIGNPELQSDIATYPDFCGYIYYQPEGIRRRAEFRRSMRESRVALCPESIPGVLPYRFFEAMSAGRIPLLVGSDYVLPFADEIPYDDFIIRCPAESAPIADQVALEFIRAHSDTAIIDKGLEARHYWRKYLNREDWPRTMAEAVLKRLEVTCV